MPAPSEKRGRAISWGLFLMAIVVSCALNYFYLRYYYEPPPSPSEAEAPPTSTKPDKVSAVSALGRIEPRDGVLSLGVAVPDRIRRLLVKEGDKIKKNERLAILDSQRMRELELELARTQRKQAEIRLQDITASGEAQMYVEQLRRDNAKELEPLEIKTLESKIAFLKRQRENAERDRDHYVAAGDTIAKQNVEKQELAIRQFETELFATESQLKKLRTSSKLKRSLADAQLKAMQAELKQNQSAISLDQLDTQVKQAEERLKETEVRAPCDGKSLRIFVHEGELVQAQPILQMANVDNMIVVAEVPVSDKPDIHVKSRATITSPVFEKELGGEVYSILDIVGKPQVISQDPLARMDYRVVEVKIKLDENEPAARYIGHQVTVKIKREKRGDGKP